MKRIILFLLFLAVPMGSWASDHCTDPDKYTIDKRCYVTDKQKKESPYNAVVDVDGKCTGTVVKQDDDNLYLYTAKHCVAKSDGGIKPEIWITFQNGKDSIVELVAAGDDLDDGDWAMYRLLPNYFKRKRDWWSGYVYHKEIKNSKDTVDYVYVKNNVDNLSENFISVGYGALKIMSDKDIETFKKRYLNYLKQQGVAITEENRLDYGLFNDGDIATHVESFQQFIIDKFIYTDSIVYDPRLKFSKCVGMHDCQSWAGDSGGPLFDDKNRLVAVHSQGRRFFGGPNHARSAWNVSTIDIYNAMKELKEMEPKVILIKDN